MGECATHRPHNGCGISYMATAERERERERLLLTLCLLLVFQNHIE